MVDRHRLRQAALWATTFVPIGNRGDTKNIDPFTRKLFPEEVDIATLLSLSFSVALSVGAVLAVLRIAYAGYLYMGQADMWSTKGRAKEIFRDTIIGLIMLFGIWLILNQINPDLLNLNPLRCLPSPPPPFCGGK